MAIDRRFTRSGKVPQHVVRRLVLLVHVWKQVVLGFEIIVDVRPKKPRFGNMDQVLKVEPTLAALDLKNLIRKEHACRLSTDLTFAKAMIQDVTQIANGQVASGNADECQLVRDHRLNQYSNDLLKMMFYVSALI